MITRRSSPARSSLAALSLAALSLPALSLSALGGCAVEPPPGVALRSTLLPLTGPCPEDGAGASELAGEVSRLRVEISGPGIAEPLVAEGGVDEITIDGVPAGEGRTVAVFGLTDDGMPTWRGVRPNVTVAQDDVTPVDVLLARIADLTCARAPQTERRMFHTATRLDDGRVLLVGGARSETDASNLGPGWTLLDASGTAEIYDPGTGTFTPAGTLQVPRMFHKATLLPNGRVAISGGTSEAVVVPVDDAHPFPIKPRLAPISLIEVWDPTTGEISATLASDDPNGPRLFHAATATADGYLLLAGGVPSTSAVNDLGNALADTTLCDADTLACVAGPTMNKRRAGHAAFLLEGGDVLVWGGSVEPAAGGFRAEMLRNGASAFELVDTAGLNDNRFNVFFAATTQYQSYRVLAAGGLVRSEDGTFALSAVDKAGSVRGAVYVFDAAQGGDGALSAGPYVNDVLDPLALRAPSFLGSAAPLPGGTRAVVAGGFRDLDLTPSDQLDLYSEDPFTVAPLSVGGQPRVLREPRGGLAAVGVGDGTVLFSGGASADAQGARTPRMTAEVFADPVAPGSAE